MHINNQTILHFVNLWCKEIPINISFPSIVNQIVSYLDERVRPSSVICIITRYKPTKYKNKTGKKSQRGVIHGLFKSNLSGNG